MFLFQAYEEDEDEVLSIESSDVEIADTEESGDDQLLEDYSHIFESDDPKLAMLLAEVDEDGGWKIMREDDKGVMEDDEDKLETKPNGDFLSRPNLQVSASPAAIEALLKKDDLNGDAGDQPLEVNAWQKLNEAKKLEHAMQKEAAEKKRQEKKAAAEKKRQERKEKAAKKMEEKKVAAENKRLQKEAKKKLLQESQAKENAKKKINKVATHFQKPPKAKPKDQVEKMLDWKTFLKNAHSRAYHKEKKYCEGYMGMSSADAKKEASAAAQRMVKFYVQQREDGLFAEPNVQL